MASWLKDLRRRWKTTTETPTTTITSGTAWHTFDTRGIYGVGYDPNNRFSNPYWQPTITPGYRPVTVTSNGTSYDALMKAYLDNLLSTRPNQMLPTQSEAQDELRKYLEASNKNIPKEEKPQMSKYTPGVPIMDYVNQEIENKAGDEDRLKWLRVFRNCVLPEHVRTTIEDALVVILNKAKFDEWGINKHFEKGVTNSVLLYGPPGTGKTMISESIAAILGMNLLKVSSGDLQSPIPGQTERNITENFALAKQKNAVLMFDECDSILYNRDAVGFILAAEINTLLGAIENHDGVVILTTNRLGRLDPALQRRIIAKVELGLPKQPERFQIWTNLLPPEMPVEKDLNIDLLSQFELSGGEIKNAILLAARRAIAKNQEYVCGQCFEHGVISVLDSKEDFEKRAPKQLGGGLQLVVEDSGQVRSA